LATVIVKDNVVIKDTVKTERSMRAVRGADDLDALLDVAFDEKNLATTNARPSAHWKIDPITALHHHKIAKAIEADEKREKQAQLKAALAEGRAEIKAASARASADKKALPSGGARFLDTMRKKSLEIALAEGRAEITKEKQTPSREAVKELNQVLAAQHAEEKAKATAEKAARPGLLARAIKALHVSTEAKTAPAAPASVPALAVVQPVMPQVEYDYSAEEMRAALRNNSKKEEPTTPAIDPLAQFAALSLAERHAKTGTYTPPKEAEEYSLSALVAATNAREAARLAAEKARQEALIEERTTITGKRTGEAGDSWFINEEEQRTRQLALQIEKNHARFLASKAENKQKAEVAAAAVTERPALKAEVKKTLSPAVSKWHGLAAAAAVATVALSSLFSQNAADTRGHAAPQAPTADVTLPAPPAAISVLTTTDVGTHKTTTVIEQATARNGDVSSDPVAAAKILAGIGREGVINPIARDPAAQACATGNGDACLTAAQNAVRRAPDTMLETHRAVAMPDSRIVVTEAEQKAWEKEQARLAAEARKRAADKAAFTAAYKHTQTEARNALSSTAGHTVSYGRLVRTFGAQCANALRAANISVDDGRGSSRAVSARLKDTEHPQLPASCLAPKR
jgi:hypothetical protein